METIYSIQTNIIGLLIVFIVFSNIITKRNKHFSEQNILLLSLITFFALVGDILATITNNEPGTTNLLIAHIGNILQFSANVIPPLIWILYIHYEVHHNYKQSIQLQKLFRYIYYFFGIIAVTSFFTGLAYSINDVNEYSRGLLFVMYPAINSTLSIIALIYIYMYRTRLSKRGLYTLIFFAFPSIIGGVIQSFTSYTALWLGTSISVLVLYIYYLESIKSKDYITGLNNRYNLAGYVSSLLTEEIPFSVLTFQIQRYTDDKEFTHAMKYLAKNTLKHIDYKSFVGRFGQDSLILVTKHSNANYINLELMIKKAFEAYNKKHEKHIELLAYSDTCTSFDVNTNQYLLNILDKQKG